MYNYIPSQGSRVLAIKESGTSISIGAPAKENMRMSWGSVFTTCVRSTSGCSVSCSFIAITIPAQLHIWLVDSLGYNNIAFIVLPGGAIIYAVAGNQVELSVYI